MHSAEHGVFAHLRGKAAISCYGDWLDGRVFPSAEERRKEHGLVRLQLEFFCETTDLRSCHPRPGQLQGGANKWSSAVPLTAGRLPICTYGAGAAVGHWAWPGRPMKDGTNSQQAWRPSVSKGGKSVARDVGGGASHFT